MIVVIIVIVGEIGKGRVFIAVKTVRTLRREI